MSIPSSKRNGGASKCANRNPLVDLRGFSGGGAVETPQQLMARMAAKYGSTGSAQAQPAAAPAPTPQPQPIVAQAPERPRGIFNIMKTRGEQIDKASGYASGGKISGPGTPTSDSIPAVVHETGEPIKVSTNERILSYAQDQLMEGVAKKLGFSSLDKMLEAGTGKPVGPEVKSGVKAAANGAGPGDLPENGKTNPLTQIMGGGGSSPFYKPGSASDPKASGAMNFTNNPAASIPGVNTTQAPLINGQVKTVAGQMNPSMAAVTQAQPDNAVSSLLSGKQTYPELTGLRAQQSQPASSPVAEASKAAIPSALAAVVPAPAQSTAPSSAVAPGSPNAATGAGQTQEPGAVNSAQGQRQNSFTEVGKNPLTVTGPLDAHGNSMAATNAMKAQLEELTRTAPANVVMLENSGLKESQDLMDKWGRQDAQREMMQEMGRNPRAANALAGLYAAGANNEAQMRGQDVASTVNQRNNDTTQRGQDITAQTAMRGQDVHAQSEAARLSGNPLDNQLKGLQVQTGQAGIDRAQAQDKAIESIRNEQDPGKRQAMLEAHLVSQGKNPLTDRYIKVDGGEYSDQDNPGVKLKAPSGVYDTVTQSFKPMGPQPAAAQAEKTKQTAYQPGRTYTDGNGNKAIYQQDGTWKEIK